MESYNSQCDDKKHCQNICDNLDWGLVRKLRLIFLKFTPGSMKFFP